MELTATEHELQELVSRVLVAPRGIGALAAMVGLPEAIRDVVSRLRALQIADLMYMDGLSSSAVRFCVNKHGPVEYVAVERVDAGSYRLVRVPVTTALDTFRGIHALLNKGLRVAPARWEIDPDQVDARELWDRIGGSTPP